MLKMEILPAVDDRNHLELLDVGSQGAMAVYFVLDHLVWLVMNGILTVDKDILQKWKYYSNLARFIGLLIGIIRNTIQLFVNYQSQQKLIGNSKKNEIQKIYQQRKRLLLTFLRLNCDLFISAESLQYLTWNDGVLGLCGIISASEGIYSGWPTNH